MLSNFHHGGVIAWKIVSASMAMARYAMFIWQIFGRQRSPSLTTLVAGDAGNQWDAVFFFFFEETKLGHGMLLIPGWT